MFVNFVLLFFYVFFACYVFFFKQKTAYEMRISDWSSDVCSSDLRFAVTVQVGYAWIASSYRRGGYGVRMAAEDSEAARKIFIASFGQPRHTIEIGRASCRERVCQYV